MSKYFWPVLIVLSLGAQDKPCSVAPTPHIHVDDSDGGFNPSATCPTGWAVSITQAAADKYNKSRTRAAVVNMLADAPCIRETSK